MGAHVWIVGICSHIGAAFYQGAGWPQSLEAPCYPRHPPSTEARQLVNNWNPHVAKFILINYGISPSCPENEGLSSFFKAVYLIFFTTMPHKAKQRQWITKEKSFPAWHIRADTDAGQRWCVLPSFKLTHPLHQFRLCVVRLVLACTVSRWQLHCTCQVMNFNAVLHLAQVCEGKEGRLSPFHKCISLLSRYW